MKILRVADASFARDGVDLIAPFSLALDAGDATEVGQPTALAASIAARICAAIVRPTHGTVYVGEYETRLQPPQAKRMVGFVDASGFAGDVHALRCEVAFRSDVWNLDKAAAQARATQLLEQIGDGPYARGIVLALVADVALVVLDQPAKSFVKKVRRLVPEAAVLATLVAGAASAPREPALAAAR